MGTSCVRVNKGWERLAVSNHEGKCGAYHLLRTSSCSRRLQHPAPTGLSQRLQLPSPQVVARPPTVPRTHTIVKHRKKGREAQATANTRFQTWLLPVSTTALGGLRGQCAWVHSVCLLAHMKAW
jgi:hypothetical protein